MSIERIWQIACDGCGRKFTSYCEQKQQAQAEATGEGWALRLPSGGGYDYCPECVKEGS